MRWTRTLTRSQRLILLGLAFSVLAVFGLLTWSVWSTLSQGPGPSPLPTPAAVGDSVLPTPTRTPTAAPTATPSPTATADFDVSRAGVIAAEVADAREARTRWGTPLTLVDDTAMAQALYAHYGVKPPLVAQARVVLTALDLWFWDPLRLDIVAQSQEAAAFYAPELEELYLRRDWTGTQPALERQLAYGYARALPDQLGNMAALADETTTLDRRLALAAVAEGDALITLMLVEGLEPGSREAQTVQAEIARAVCPIWRTKDALLEDLSCLSFNLGSAFATARYREGGLAALDEAILRPPRSTEQILYPECYVEPDEPEVLLPLEPALDNGWALTTTDTLGEAIMGIVLEEWSNESVGAEAVTGWGGDLLQVWQGPEGETAAAWQTAWDEAKGAGRFYGRLLDLLPRGLIRGLITDTTPPMGVPRGRWWAGSRGALFLHRRANRVWVIWGHDPAAVEALATAIP